VQIICVDPATDAQWSQLLEAHPGSLFHSPPWIRAIQQTYGLKIQAYLAYGSTGVPLGGMTFCHIDDILEPRIASMPFSDYCDPLISDCRVWEAITERIQADQRTIMIRCLFNDLPLGDERFTLYKRAKWHQIELQSDVDSLWQSIDAESRRAIRKARKSDVVVRPATNRQELRRFYELHLRIRKYKYQMLAQPYCLFEHLWEQFIEQQNGFLMLAFQHDTLIGGIFFLGWNDTIYYKFNASDHTYLQVRPNDLMVWESMCYARERGYHQLDLGLSDWDQAGLVRYKRKFATTEKTISFLRHTPGAAQSPRDAPLRGLINQLTTLFVDPSVPDEVTERAGRLLYRFFT
jgi:CelD/BcsL family acetyltransferase involved in cellulose biosynthesis